MSNRSKILIKVLVNEEEEGIFDNPLQVAAVFGGVITLVTKQRAAEISSNRPGGKEVPANGTPAILMKAAGFDMFIGGFTNITC
jgi:hypothetical protein